MSKGDKPRPLSVSFEEYEKRWDKAFGKKEKEEKPKNIIELNPSRSLDLEIEKMKMEG